MTQRQRLPRAEATRLMQRRTTVPIHTEMQPARCATCGAAVRPHRNDPCKCYPRTDREENRP